MNNELLLTGSSFKLLKKYSLPCVISLLVGALYNIVDQIFIANASYLGSSANAANTAVFPLTVVALAIAVMIGDGCCSIISIYQGKGERANILKSVGNAISSTILASLFITIIYLLSSDQLLMIFGASVNADTFNFAKVYLFYITLGIPFYMFGQALNPIIRADGSPAKAMAFTLSGCFINIILDPIFIYPLAMGMKGAAIATVIGQFITALLSLIYLFNMQSGKLKLDDFKIKFSLIKKICVLGASSFLAQISNVLTLAASQSMILKTQSLDPIFANSLYAAIPLAVYGIMMKFYQIFMAISIGLSAGLIPVIGYNMGAQHKERVKNLLNLLLKAQLICGVLGFISAEIFPNLIISLFGAAGESQYYTSFAIHAFRLSLCLIFLSTINKGTFIFMQAMSKARESVLLSLLREIVFGIGYVLLLPNFFGLDGVLLAMPCAEISTFIFTLIVLYKTRVELSEEKVTKKSY